MRSDLKTFPVSTGVLDPRHVKAIDPSSPLWIYLWLLNRVTRDEENGEQFNGIVLHGQPVGIQQIADELGIGYHACRRHLAHLAGTGYVERKKTGAGMFTYTVTKSKRWAWKRQAAATRNQSSSSTEKQADLFPPMEAPTEQNPLSGSRDPRSGNRSQSADPKSGNCTSTEQNPLCALIECARGHSSHKDQKPQTPEVTKFNTTEVALILCRETGWSGTGMIWALTSAIEYQSKRNPEAELGRVGASLVEAYVEYAATKGTFACGPQKFFEQGLYCATRKTNIYTDNPATRAAALMQDAT